MSRSHPHRPLRLIAVLALAAVAVITGACSSRDPAARAGSSTSTENRANGSPRSTVPGPSKAIVFNGQGNNLDAYGTQASADGTFPTQRVLTAAATDPINGRDANAQICFLPPTDDGEQWFISGEDTGQQDPARPAGWGIFRLNGNEIGDLSAIQIGKLVPTFQPANDNPENYGCGVLPDGRVLTTDVGNQASGDGDGQLIIWFPPLTGGSYPKFDGVRYCKLDIGLPTAQSILVRDDGSVLVAAARGGVYRYQGPFPTSADASGGCAGKDGTGAPLADRVNKTTFIATGERGMATPAGLAPAPDGGVYVSSVFSGVINEYGPDGAFRRNILEPPAGEQLGATPFSTGTPLGIGVESNGTLYYADIGITVTARGVGPGDKTGSVRRITFVDGTPRAPQTMATGLDFPDGIGVWNPATAGRDNPA